MINYAKGVLEGLRLKYSFPKFQWIVGTISLTSLIYLSSEEIWKTVYVVSVESFFCYSIFFLIILIIVHYIDTKRVIQDNSVAICVSLISIVFDIGIISFAELIVLYTLQVLPQDYIKVAIILLIGAMPSSTGAIVLSSMAGDVLRKRAEKLYKEIQDITKQVEKLQDQISESKEHLKSFEKKKSEFEEYFKRQEQKRGNPDGK